MLILNIFIGPLNLVYKFKTLMLLLPLLFQIYISECEKVSHIAAVKDWQIGFQKPSTGVMEGIGAFHDDLFVFLVLILGFLIYLFSVCLIFFSEKRKIYKLWKVQDIYFEVRNIITFRYTRGGLYTATQEYICSCFIISILYWSNNIECLQEAKPKTDFPKTRIVNELKVEELNKNFTPHDPSILPGEERHYWFSNLAWWEQNFFLYQRSQESNKIQEGGDFRETSEVSTSTHEQISPNQESNYKPASILKHRRMKSFSKKSLSEEDVTPLDPILDNPKPLDNWNTSLSVYNSRVEKREVSTQTENLQEGAIVKPPRVLHSPTLKVNFKINNLSSNRPSTSKSSLVSRGNGNTVDIQKNLTDMPPEILDSDPSEVSILILILSLSVCIIWLLLLFILMLSDICKRFFHSKKK